MKKSVKSIVQRCAVMAVAAATAFAVSVPSFAAEAENNEFNAAIDAAVVVSTDEADYGELTQEEIDELNSIYERIDEIYEAIWGDADEITDEEFDRRYSQYEEELDELYERSYELEEKAGWYEVDYGDLTQEEIDELNSIYERIDEIYEAIWEDAEEITDEEFDRRYSQYKEELDKLYERELELEEKADRFYVECWENIDDSRYGFEDDDKSAYIF